MVTTSVPKSDSQHHFFFLPVFMTVSPSLDFVTQYKVQHTIFTECSEIVPSNGPPWRSLSLTCESKPLPCRGGGSSGGRWLVNSGDWSAPVNDQALKTLLLQEGVLLLSRVDIPMTCVIHQWTLNFHWSFQIKTTVNSPEDCVCLFLSHPILFICIFWTYYI